MSSLTLNVMTNIPAAPYCGQQAGNTQTSVQGRSIYAVQVNCQGLSISVGSCISPLEYSLSAYSHSYSRSYSYVSIHVPTHKPTHRVGRNIWPNTRMTTSKWKRSRFSTHDYGASIEIEVSEGRQFLGRDT